MYFGTRRIRSAGRTSGSVEVTLPSRLQSLQEVECRLTLRDGAHPEIVLQPDLSVAYGLLQQLWERLRLALSRIDEIGEFDPAAFTLGLMPAAHWRSRPPLAFVDALTVLRQGTNNGGSEALARLLAALALVASERLGLTGDLTQAFGECVAYLAVGVTIQSGLDYERGLLQQIYAERIGILVSSHLDQNRWLRVAPGLQRVWEQLEHWQADPEAYHAARQHWYRALAVELGSGQSGR